MRCDYTNGCSNDATPNEPRTPTAAAAWIRMNVALTCPKCSPKGSDSVRFLALSVGSWGGVFSREEGSFRSHQQVAHVHPTELTKKHICILVMEKRCVSPGCWPLHNQRWVGKIRRNVATPVRRNTVHTTPLFIRSKGAQFAYGVISTCEWMGPTIDMLHRYGELYYRERWFACDRW